MVDLATQGIGAGRIWSPTGGEQVGKTTQAYEAILNAIWRYKVVVVVYDHEGSFNIPYMQALADKKYPGLVVADHIRMTRQGPKKPKTYFRPPHGEWTFRHMSRLLQRYLNTKAKKKPELLIVLDSVAAMLPKAALDEEVVTTDAQGNVKVKIEEGNNAMGSQARMFSQNLPKVKNLISKAHAYCIFINQLRFKIGTMGDPTAFPGGNAMAHNTDQRMTIRRFSPQKAGDAMGGKKVSGKGAGTYEAPHPSGNGTNLVRYSRVTVDKNKLGPPLRNAQYRIITEERGGTGRGIDEVYDTLQYLRATGQMSVSGSYWKVTLMDHEGQEVIHEGSYYLKDLMRMIAYPGYVGTFGGMEVYDRESGLDIRESCYKQIETRDEHSVSTADKLYEEAVNSGVVHGVGGEGKIIELIIGKPSSRARKDTVLGYRVELAGGHVVEIHPEFTPAERKVLMENPDLVVGNTININPDDYAVEEDEIEGEPEPEAEEPEPEKPVRKRKASGKAKKAASKKGKGAKSKKSKKALAAAVRAKLSA